jgi:hypothetical protein
MVIRGHGAKMNRLWVSAIRALMTENTIQAAAARVGISRNTLAAWMRDDDFRSAYKEVQKHQQAALMKRLAEEIPVDSWRPAALPDARFRAC